MKVTIIRVNGLEEAHELTLTPDAAIVEIKRLIGATSDRGIDIVNLRDGRVMFVDGAGYETKEYKRLSKPNEFPFIRSGVEVTELIPVRPLKPANDKATVLYLKTCKPGTVYQIVGDVAIVVDADFA